MELTFNNQIGEDDARRHPYVIAANEHSSVNFEISKNEETGMITVKYTNPEALPIRFSWTATIDVNGIMTTTPMVIEKVNGGAPAVDNP